ncbi:MAG TPA: preprotein translocase subunit SecE [Chloroflexota bacterium]|jgi:preprotein translocase SecE subunit|nr:preprotein translocase subunit SecE [Chloroflexota bacterium]
MARVVKPPVAPAGGKRTTPVVRAAPAVRKQGAPVAAGRFGRLSALGSQSAGNTAVFGFFRESLAELKKVHWPSREQTIQMTIVVIVFSIATGIVLGGLDFVFAQLVAFLVGAR